MKKISIYTDGACRGNPGPGGWGAVLIYNDHRKTIFGGVPETTNNKMELTAAIKALESLKHECEVDLYTDSKYLRDGITKWIHGWKKKAWKTAANKPVKNSDLWKHLDELSIEHKVSWHWVKAHAGNPENELADELANRGIDELMQEQANG